MDKENISYDPYHLSSALLSLFQDSQVELDNLFKKANIESDEETQWLINLFAFNMPYLDPISKKRKNSNSQHFKTSLINHITGNLEWAKKYCLPLQDKALNDLLDLNGSIFETKQLNTLEWLLFAQVVRDLSAIALKNQDSDSFVGLFMQYKFCLGTYVAQGKHEAVRSMQSSLIGSMAHEKTNKIKREIEAEYESRKKLFKRRGYSAEFKREMIKKHPEILEQKTIEKWITAMNKKNDEIPSKLP